MEVKSLESSTIDSTVDSAVHPIDICDAVCFILCTTAYFCIFSGTFVYFIFISFND